MVEFTWTDSTALQIGDSVALQIGEQNSIILILAVEFFYEQILT
jgi:hypothetical protein